MSLKLKLDHATSAQQAECEQRMSTAERYGDAQREITRMNEQRTHMEVTLSEDNKENNMLVQKVKEMIQANDGFAEQMLVVNQREKALEFELARVKEYEKMRENEREKQMAQRVTQMEAEIHVLRSKLEEQESSAGLLEQYKKRTQANIKKVI
jgi:hypothetical protein